VAVSKQVPEGAVITTFAPAIVQEPLAVVTAVVLAFVVAATANVDSYWALPGAPVKLTVGTALFTTWLNAKELLAVNGLPVPGENPAVMLWEPTAKALGVKAAVPPFKVAGKPTVTPSTLNCTAPDGAIAPLAGITFAVIAKICPYDDGFREDISVVVVPTPSPAPLSEMVCVALLFKLLSLRTRLPLSEPTTMGMKSRA
jgi:hypothetical protein